MALLPFNRFTRSVLTGLAVFSCAFSFSPQSYAEAIIGDLGIGVGYRASDPTGVNYDVAPFPYLDLNWGDVSLSSDEGLNWKAIKFNGWSVGPFANYLPGRTSNGSLRGLRDVSDMGEFGGFVQYSPADFWRVFAEMGRAVGGSNGQGGVLGRIGGELGYPMGFGVIGDTEITAHYSNGRQAQTFFGVSAQEAQASGFQAYNASGGLQKVALTQSLRIPLADGWSLLTSATWTHLTQSAADSSIVKEKGDSNQGEVNIAVAYHFKGL
ncbi:MipA/OmpV family protein [Pseudomonas sp. 10B1]|uniref:MipA/OmpV family protein n=1 Tax=unclassified Pseudomonas TaxID=196821 RepID=UPI002AB45937|nr:MULTISPECIES: MipA/OmpV family protein [unclassified Pseudomonas]MDY7561640.1 MipA/OmpV family protein [Pseudomonas sp. AB6]MEA9979792.1 MipA/OmpV family protein [Pseudomonas sp. RTS4]MEA9994604.1 MipA/OmpV family protein [Pseudomonas sp. AA4]MEB0085749.1 MipA/OmpV family protein [Pseudomonas sp. RTI1]MEB0125926.1 MipA/OmpV family protein [Pseudomonas sp. CCC1.2]